MTRLVRGLGAEKALAANVLLRIFVLLGLSVLLPFSAAGDGVQTVQPLAHKPAGITLYAVEDGEVFLLLADHAMPSQQRGWASFGGMNEAGETTAETAARETEEETNGFFNRRDLLAQIKDQSPLVDGNFTFYFARVDKVPVEDIMSRQNGLLSRFYRERVHFIWLPWQQAERYLRVSAKGNPQAYAIDARYLPSTAQETWLWARWLNNFRVAARAGRLPWLADAEKNGGAATGAAPHGKAQ